MKIKLRYQLLLLCFLALAAYYPVLFAGYNPIDDTKMLSAWTERNLGDLWGYFFRNGGYHYRPLVGVTFYLDHLLWGMEPGFMHLENLLLHAVNGLLLYFAVRRLFIICSWVPGYYPLGAALLFLLHPLNTEAVSWISGRFDLFAGFWILCSFNALLVGVRPGKLASITASAVLFFVACLAKESAIFFYGGAILLIYFLNRRLLSTNTQALLASLSGWMIWSLSAALYFLYRNFALSGRDGGIGAVTGTAVAAESVFDVFDKIRITFKVMGFYLKKLFMPLPLNFAIVEVEDYYVLFGAILLVLVLVMLRNVWVNNDIASIMFLSAAGLALAGLIVALGKMAWTPVAERYMYMPSMFFVVGLVFLVRRYYLPSFSMLIQRTAIVALIVLFLTITLHRSWVWSDPIRFLEDTVTKSPDFPVPRNDLAFQYFLKGDIEKAQQIYESISEDVGHLPYANADMNAAAVLSAKGSFGEARDRLHTRLHNPGKKFNDVAEKLIEVNNRYLATITDKELEKELLQENLDLLIKMNNGTRDSFMKYRLAKAHLALEEKQEACAYFRGAYEGAPADAHYRVPAGKLAGKVCAD